MEMISIIISVLSLLISFVVTGIPFYYNYIVRREEIELIACDGIIRDNVMHIIVTYVNRSWKNATIISSHIGLSYHNDIMGRFTKSNHECSCRFINPIVLSAKMHSTVKLDYPLPSLGGLDVSDIVVYIYTEYIGAQGGRFFDYDEIGHLNSNGDGSKSVWIESFTHQLQKRKIVMSMKH